MRERLVISHFNTFTKGSVLQAGPFLFTGFQSYIISISRQNRLFSSDPHIGLFRPIWGAFASKEVKRLLNIIGLEYGLHFA